MYVNMRNSHIDFYLETGLKLCGLHISQLTANETMGHPTRFRFSSTGLRKTLLLFLCQRSVVCSSFVRSKFGLWNFAFYVRRAVEN
jgi:hypothetical protein